MWEQKLKYFTNTHFSKAGLKPVTELLTDFTDILPLES